MFYTRYEHNRYCHDIMHACYTLAPTAGCQRTLYLSFFLAQLSDPLPNTSPSEITTSHQPSLTPLPS